MRITGIMIFCEDVPLLTSFYRDVVGLFEDDVSPFSPEKFARFKSKDGATLCLHSGTKPNGGRQKLMIQADDIEALIQRVKKVKRGFKTPKPNEEGKIMFDFFDPEGNRIQVVGVITEK